MKPRKNLPDDREGEVLVRSVTDRFEQYIKHNKKVPPEVMNSLSGIEDASRLADTIAAHMSMQLKEKQRILEAFDVPKRLETLLSLIEGEIEMLRVERRGCAAGSSNRWKKASENTI